MAFVTSMKRTPTHLHEQPLRKYSKYNCILDERKRDPSLRSTERNEHHSSIDDLWMSFLRSPMRHDARNLSNHSPCLPARLKHKPFRPKSSTSHSHQHIPNHPLYTHDINDADKLHSNHRAVLCTSTRIGRLLVGEHRPPSLHPARNRLSSPHFGHISAACRARRPLRPSAQRGIPG